MLSSIARSTSRMGLRARHMSSPSATFDLTGSFEVRDASVLLFDSSLIRLFACCRKFQVESGQSKIGSDTGRSGGGQLQLGGDQGETAMHHGRQKKLQQKTSNDDLFCSSLLSLSLNKIQHAGLLVAHILNSFLLYLPTLSIYIHLYTFIYIAPQP
jgi:hypothetical protein